MGFLPVIVTTSGIATMTNNLDNPDIRHSFEINVMRGIFKKMKTGDFIRPIASSPQFQALKLYVKTVVLYIS